MDLPREVEKCVAFVGHRSKSNLLGEIQGTCLLLVRRTEIFGFNIFWALTAAHVVHEIQDAGKEAEIRVNAVEQGAAIRPPFSQWFFPHGEVDLAAACLTESVENDPEKWDHWALPWEVVVPELVNNADPRSIYLGDPVFVPGLFFQRRNEYVNVPVVRFGNVAGMPEEPVWVKLGSSRKSSDAKVKAYLVELHSQQGLSGSPVFVCEQNAESMIRGEVTWHTRRSRDPIYLLGILSGHFGADETARPEKLGADQAEINFGIAVVVPHDEIAAFFDSPQIRAHEEMLCQGKLKAMGDMRAIAD